jgi:hypothetical protein
MFTRTTELKKIISTESQSLQLLISSVSSTKVWICNFDDFANLWLAECLVELSKKSEGKNLFEGDKSSIEQSRQTFKTIVEEFSQEIDSLLLQTKIELNALRESLRVMNGGISAENSSNNQSDLRTPPRSGRSNYIERQPSKLPPPSADFLRKRSSLLLIDPGSNKIEVIKAVQNATKCGLKEGKALVDNPPSVIANQLDENVVLGLRNRLSALGAITEIF